MTAKFVLWGGPEDGKEVEVLSNDTQVVINSPSTRDPRHQPTRGMPPTRQAVYAWNRDTRKFEWKRYK